MTLTIKNAANLTTPWVAFFLYGPTGSSKTFSAASFPAPFFILPSNEGSVLTLQGMDIPYVELDNRNDMNDALAYLEAGHAKMQMLMAQGREEEANLAFPYQTVVVESLSHYCDLIIEDLSQRGVKQMDHQQWGKLTSHLRGIHSRLRALDVHIVYTSLDKVDDQGVGQPLMVGQMALKMPSGCDYIGYCEAVSTMKDKPVQYRIHFRQYGKFPARARQSPMNVEKYGAFPAIVDNFRFDKIKKYCGIED
jgi:hypothetical protein